MTAARTSDKTIESAAIRCIPVMFTLSAGWSYKGYMVGMDTFHWKIVDKDGVIHLIHKTGCVVSIDDSDIPWTELTPRVLPEEVISLIEMVADPFRQAAIDKRKKGQAP